jgi:hypothetical protein
MHRSEVEALLPSLTARDVAILTAVYQYRYLNSRQVHDLFFPSSRSTQMRLRWMAHLGLLVRWSVIHPPGWRRGHSVVVLSRRGAAVLAGCRNDEVNALIRRSLHAQEHCLHLTHDLESNGFFVAVAAASRWRHDQGLYHWVGEESCRSIYRIRGAALTPDGWGRYLVGAEGEVVFFLEWDRATESPQRLGEKATSYLRHFTDRRGADRHNVLWVAPAQAREMAIRRAIEQSLPATGGPPCRFWTTNLLWLEERGLLGSVWQSATAELGDRLPLTALPLQPRSERSTDACIGKPGWWERRPGGGEGA